MAVQNIIEYIAIATASNTTDFGDLTEATGYTSALSDGTKGLRGGGTLASGNSDVIDYVNIASTGNATDFGDLSATRDALAAASNGTRGVFTGGIA